MDITPKIVHEHKTYIKNVCFLLGVVRKYEIYIVISSQTGLTTVRVFVHVLSVL